MERRITVIDGEGDRLAATTRVLETLFDDAILESELWRNKRVRTYALEKAAEISEWTREGRASLLVTNIDGVEEGLAGALLAVERRDIHYLLTTCYGVKDTEEVLHTLGLKLSPSLGHIECPTCGLNALDERRKTHRTRLEEYFASLPPDHPFSIGSKSTTYSTLLPETYAASSR